MSEDTTVTPTAHDHEWQRRQNVTSRGYRMTPYEVCVADGCDAARQVDEPAALMPATPTVKPTLEQVVDALAAQPPGNGEWTSSGIMQAARAVLALYPGRTEAEVKAEALRDAADDPVAEEFLRALPAAEYSEHAVETSAEWLLGLAARIAQGGQL